MYFYQVTFSKLKTVTTRQSENFCSKILKNCTYFRIFVLSLHLRYLTELLKTCFRLLLGHENYVIFSFASLRIACKSCSIFSVQIFAVSRCASVFTLVFLRCVRSAARLVRRKCARNHAPQVTHTVIMSIARIPWKKLSGNCARSIDSMPQCGKFYVGFLHLLRNIIFLLSSYQWTKPAIGGCWCCIYDVVVGQRHAHAWIFFATDWVEFDFIAIWWSIVEYLSIVCALNCNSHGCTGAILFVVFM